MNCSRTILPFCLRALCVAGMLLVQARAEIQYVIAISIDGARGDFIRTFVETAPTEFPNFIRLRDMSGYTFNARCDYTESITIPDHLCMLTGRPVRQPAGLPATIPHGIISDAPATADTAHNSGLNPGVYKASIFDVVHDRGFGTALYMGKTRLQICERSWNATNGALDVIGPDNGRDKIDVANIMEAMGTMATSTMLGSFLATIQNTTLKNFTLFHVADTDYAGHSGTWSTAAGSTYRNGMRLADGWLGQILDTVENNPALTGKVALILTADHGGGTPANNHTDATNATNYTIPFFLSAPGIAGGTNVYDYFENRFEAGTGRPTYADAAQPFRNGDVANLAAALLGLPSVPGSLLVPELKKPLLLAQNGNTMTVSWPIYLTGYTLEYTDDLAAASWTPVSSGIVESNGQRIHTFTFPPPSQRFFRLRKPSDVAGGMPRQPGRLLPRSIISPDLRGRRPSL